MGTVGRGWGNREEGEWGVRMKKPPLKYTAVGEQGRGRCALANLTLWGLVGRRMRAWRLA